MQILYIIAAFSGAIICLFVLLYEHRKHKRYEIQKKWLKKKHMQD